MPSGSALSDKMFRVLVQKRLSPELRLPESCINTISQMIINDHCTIPFLVRYRQKEMHGHGEAKSNGKGISAAALFQLKQELEKWESLVKLRISRQSLLRKDGKWDEATILRLDQCLSRAELDEMYEGLKPSPRASKAEAARAVPGLEEAARLLLNEKNGDSVNNSNNKIDTKKLSEVLKMNRLDRNDKSFCQHLKNLMSSCIAHSSIVLTTAKDSLLRSVRVNSHEASSSRTTKSGEEKQDDISKASKYQDYFDFERSLIATSAHQILALRRGKQESKLKVSLHVDDKALSSFTRKLKYVFHVIDPNNFSAESLLNWRNVLLVDSIKDSLHRSVVPTITRLAWKNAIERAEEESLGCFSRNLRHLLMTPPLSQYLNIHKHFKRSEASVKSLIVCGIDPGFSHGHKIVVLSFPLPVVSSPGVMACTKIYSKKKEEAVYSLAEFIKAHAIQVIAIGNGVGSKEAEDITNQAVIEVQKDQPTYSCNMAIVNEVGASVYSVSSLANEEYPDIDISFRGAISIASRLVDPLREMVKISPSSLGIGMYQHDLKDTVLSRRLAEVLQEIVSEVGVDINTASEEMLTYVSGVQRSRAKAIVSHRQMIGGFTNRDQIKQVPGIGDTTFRNCAGFLRIYPPSSENDLEKYEPLDMTIVHPESYEAARVLLECAHRGDVSSASRKGISKAEVRNLLFSQELHSFLEKLSDAEWSEIAARCSHSLSIDTPNSITVSDTKQLGRWLSSNEFRGDAYALSCSSSSIGVRSVRGQPPKLITAPLAPSKKRTAPGDSDTGGGYAKRSRLGNIKDDGYTSKNIDSGASEVRIGAHVTGTVRNITSFGVFVDIGSSRDGLLHCSEVKKESGGANWQDRFALGERIDVKIKSVDYHRDRVSLTLH